VACRQAVCLCSASPARNLSGRQTGLGREEVNDGQAVEKARMQTDPEKLTWWLCQRQAANTHDAMRMANFKILKIHGFIRTKRGSQIQSAAATARDRFVQVDPR
jgi:hypothetical protein